MEYNGHKAQQQWNYALTGQTAIRKNINDAFRQVDTFRQGADIQTENQNG